jgi:GT2 family glycosyltransferase
MAPTVTAVVLNHARPEESLRCLASLARSTYPNLSAIVLDTGHVAGAASELRSSFPDVELVELARNLGYAGNNNVGLERAIERGADWIFLLNDDVVVAPDCVARLVAAGAEGSRIGMTGPTVYDREAPTTVQSAGGELTSGWHAAWKSAGDVGSLNGTPRDVEWLAGCALLVRGELCAEVGLLDQRFFMYWEEVDWCLRAAGRGWRIVHVPGARVWHRRADRVPPPAFTYYMTRNRLLALRNRYPRARVWLPVAGRLVATLAGRSAGPSWQSTPEHRAAMRHGVVDFVRGRFGERY